MPTTPSFLNRRQFIQLSATVAAGLAIVPRGGQAARAAAPRDQAVGFYRFAMGEMTITVLNDGSFLVPSDIAPIEIGTAELQALNADPKERETYFRERLVPVDNIPIPACPTVIDTERERILIDSGWAHPLAPSTTGRLGAALEAAGISRDSIDMVILTHAHPDHLGGLLDRETKQLQFRNARVIISETELDLWTGEDGERRLRDLPIPLPAIRGVLRELGDRLQPMPAGREITRGVRTLASPGHTTGHIAVALESNRQQLLVIGDALTSIHASFEHPEWHNLFDLDPQQAALTRKRLLDQAATDEMLILGYHLPFPGLGRALRAGEAYRWYPAGWLVLP